VSEGARDRLFALAAAALLGLGVVVWTFGRPVSGVALTVDATGQTWVESVMPGSVGWTEGARAGMLVIAVDGDPTAPRVPPTWNQILLTDPAGDAELAIASDTPLHSLVLPALWIGFAELAALWVALRRDRRTRLLGPLALATIAALALVPEAAFGSPVALLIATLAWPLSTAPLAYAIAQQAENGDVAHQARQASSVALIAALLVTPLLFVLPVPAAWLVVPREALVAVGLLAPVALIASTTVRTSGGWASSAAAISGTVGIAAAALAPLVLRLLTSVPIDAGSLVFVGLWTAAGGFAVRFGVIPLARVARHALRQRDLVAAAADAERRRIAADLHDGPLQALTLLAYRLDAAGDADDAELARDVVTELRAITSALRLPVVDDLGAGPALEWLTERVGRLAGTPIELVRADAERPPLEVEHAVFRVAQEAISNAARHGRPPICVRYDASAGRAALVVVDSGRALARLDSIEDEGGLGLVGMRERAHAIGAALDIGSSALGTRVSLVWPGVAS
jgi:signal transduction histidine kinase